MSVHTEEKLLVAVARVTSLGSMGLALARKARLMKMKMKMELTICILLVVGGLKEVWRLSALAGCWSFAGSMEVECTGPATVVFVQGM